MIATTVNIEQTLHENLRQACQKTGKSHSFIVTTLLFRVDRRHMKRIKLFKRVKYQPRLSTGNWSLLHIKLTPELYEKCQDLRKFSKHSLSFLLALEIQLSLEEIVKEILGLKLRDNYSILYTVKMIKGENFTQITINTEEKQRK